LAEKIKNHEKLTTRTGSVPVVVNEYLLTCMRLKKSEYNKRISAKKILSYPRFGQNSRNAENWRFGKDPLSRPN
jgi:hypothetical protein